MDSYKRKTKKDKAKRNKELGKYSQKHIRQLELLKQKPKNDKKNN